MGELVDFSKNEIEHIDWTNDGILNGDGYQKQRDLLEQFLAGNIPYTSNPASQAQARGMAENIGIELPSSSLNLYDYLRSLATPFTDQEIFDEVLRLTKNQNRADFRKFYPNIFPAINAQSDHELPRAA